MKPIDEIDRKLLNELQSNSRITIRELSEKLHLSTTPIHERIKNAFSTVFMLIKNSLLLPHVGPSLKICQRWRKPEKMKHETRVKPSWVKIRQSL